MKNIDFTGNLPIGIIGCLVGWIATWVVEYLIASVLGFPNSTCVWFIIKLNVFVIAVVVAICGITIGGTAIEQWTREKG